MRPYCYDGIVTVLSVTTGHIGWGSGVAPSEGARRRQRGDDGISDLWVKRRFHRPWLHSSESYILPPEYTDYTVMLHHERIFIMRAVVTRVSSASVEIDGVIRGKINRGFLVLLGIKEGDSEADAEKLASKVCNLRVFADAEGKMNLDLEAAGGSLLVISQFTLYADCKSRRPGFTAAARPDTAIPLYELFIDQCRDAGFVVETGEFGAMMNVSSVNDGPVTILLDTETL